MGVRSGRLGKLPLRRRSSHHVYHRDLSKQRSLLLNSYRRAYLARELLQAISLAGSAGWERKTEFR